MIHASTSLRLTLNLAHSVGTSTAVWARHRRTPCCRSSRRDVRHRAMQLTVAASLPYSGGAWKVLVALPRVLRPEERNFRWMFGVHGSSLLCHPKRNWGRTLEEHVERPLGPDIANMARGCFCDMFAEGSRRRGPSWPRCELGGDQARHVLAGKSHSDSVRPPPGSGECCQILLPLHCDFAHYEALLMCSASRALIDGRRLVVGPGVANTCSVCASAGSQSVLHTAAVKGQASIMRTACSCDAGHVSCARFMTEQGISLPCRPNEEFPFGSSHRCQSRCQYESDLQVVRRAFLRGRHTHTH